MSPNPLSSLTKQEGGGGFSGTVATASDPGVFAPTYGGNGKRKALAKLTAWLQKQLEKQTIPCSVGQHRHSGAEACHPISQHHSFEHHAVGAGTEEYTAPYPQSEEEDVLTDITIPAVARAHKVNPDTLYEHLAHLYGSQQLKDQLIQEPKYSPKGTFFPYRAVRLTSSQLYTAHDLAEDLRRKTQTRAGPVKITRPAAVAAMLKAFPWVQKWLPTGEDLSKAQPGLVPKKVWVHREGETFSATRWVRPTPREKATRGGIRIPPNWTDVWMSKNPNASLQAIGKDAKGRRQYLYSRAHSQKAAAEKFGRLKAFNGALPRIRERVVRNVERRQEAQILYVIDKTAFRIGGSKETHAAQKAYGVSTLLGRHVRVDGSRVAFDFIGKKGVRVQKTVQDPTLAGIILKRKRDDDQPLFRVSDRDVRGWLASVAPRFKVKDFRTWHGTQKALDEMKKYPTPASLTSFKKQRLEVSRAVAEFLGNTPAIAFGSYIAPEVWAPWEGALAQRGVQIQKQMESSEALRAVGVILHLRRAYPSRVNAYLDGTDDLADKPAIRAELDRAIGAIKAAQGLSKEDSQPEERSFSTLSDLFEAVQYNEEESTSESPVEGDEDDEDEGDGEEVVEKAAPISAKAIVVNDKGQVLALTNPPGTHDHPHDLPGGHLRPGEDPTEALLREVKEETGLDLEDVRAVDTSGTILGGQDQHPVWVYHAKVSAPEVTLSAEHTKAAWVEPTSLAHLDFGEYSDVVRSFFAEPEQPDAYTEEFYDWVDEQLTKAVPIEGNQPRGAKAVGKGIEMRLYSNLREAIDEYLASLTGKETQAQITAGVVEVIEGWIREGLPVAGEAFDELFARGFRAGALSAGMSGKMGTYDERALEVLKQGRYRIGERIRLFGDEAKKEFTGVIASVYTPEGVFDLDDMVGKMRQAVPAQRYKLERIARTETSNISNVGRLWAWDQDKDKYFYKYFWNSTPDNRRREMKKLRSAGNPYTFDEAKFLWLHNEQQIPDLGWQQGSINCRCSLSRSPLDKEWRGSRFMGQEHLFRKTMEFTF